MLQGHTNMIENLDFCSFLFQLQINENKRNIYSQKQIKIDLCRIIKFKSVGKFIELYHMERKRSHHSRGKC